jgi:hypothetical protein
MLRIEGMNMTDFFPGSVDQVHIWYRALSAADVAALCQSGR